MSRGVNELFVRTWATLGVRFMPFADVASAELPLGRLLRLTLFQLSVGMVQTLFVGTMNRVMIVELRVPASLVAIMLAIPLLVAPFRALVGFRSDTHRSIMGWRRVPYLWAGTLLQFSGLAILPFALLVMVEPSPGTPVWLGWSASALAIFLAGAGAHTTQTAGLALATDVVSEEKRPRVIALMYLMMLTGTLVSALLLESLLSPFSPTVLIQVIQGTAVFTVLCNLISLWKQEARVPGVTPRVRGERRPLFREAWRTFTTGGQAVRLLTASGLGFFAFNLQDVLLEPYGGEIMGLSVAATTGLTALMALGAMSAFGLAAYALRHHTDPLRLASYGALGGVLGFVAVIFASPLESAAMFRGGTMLIGFGEGLFGVGTLSSAMSLRDPSQHGIALGAWGAVFATAEGSSFAISGVFKDWLSHVVSTGVLGEAMSVPSVPYSFVYHVEIFVLFATLVALGPLVRPRGANVRESAVARPFGLADIPA